MGVKLFRGVDAPRIVRCKSHIASFRGLETSRCIAPHLEIINVQKKPSRWEWNSIDSVSIKPVQRLEEA